MAAESKEPAEPSVDAGDSGVRMTPAADPGAPVPSDGKGSGDAALEQTPHAPAHGKAQAGPQSHKPASGPDTLEDRPWIIKQKKPEKAAVPGKSKPVRWKDESQKKRCEQVAADLEESFLQARYHSIQGDSCTTAQFARNFLMLMDTCESECPREFVDQTGYSGSIARNIKTLHELGTERCLGAKGKVETGKGQKKPESLDR